MRETDLEAPRSRRAIGFLLLSAVLPGSVQRFAGNKGVGRLALRVVLVVLGIVTLIALALWLVPGPTVGALLTPWVMTAAKIALWLLFLGWLALLIDSWRLARPLDFPQRTRLGMTIGVGVLALACGLATGYVANAFTAAGNVGAVLPGGGTTNAHHGRYNVLLLGVDAADDREGIRPDSITVASVDEETGRTVLFGLPRNMQRVPFPEDSPMHELYPNGFHCAENGCMLNAIWTTAEDNADKFPEGSQPGLEATRAAVGETLGLDINYYALVDMAGFKSIVDAMGGIEMDVMKRIPIGGGSSPISGYIEPGKAVHLDGNHALWFARSREGASDYERMQRQKCVMAAMAGQLDPQTVATRFLELSEAGKSLLRTDVPRGELVKLADLALKAKDLEIASVNFTPPLIDNTADPNFGLIRDTVQEKITASEKAAEAAPAPAAASPSTGTSAQEPSSTPAPDASASPVEERTEAYIDGTEAEDLGSVCAAS